MKWFAGLVLGVVVAVGAHAYLRRSSSVRCPFGYDVSATPEQRAGARRQFALSHGGSGVARSHAALSWTLDSTTREQITLPCTAHGSDLECTHVGDLSALWLGFDDASHLVAVTAFHDVGPADALPRYRALVDAETSRTGSPAHAIDADVLRGALMQSSTEWRFTEVWARINVTNLGHGRFVLIEEHRSLR